MIDYQETIVYTLDQAVADGKLVDIEGVDSLARLFPLGRIVGTPGALKALTVADASPIAFLSRHASGDWGELAKESRRTNEKSLKKGNGGFLSSYKLPDGVGVWIITEADRSATTLLLPKEY